MKYDVIFILKIKNKKNYVTCSYLKKKKEKEKKKKSAHSCF